jgi:predicted ATPase
MPGKDPDYDGDRLTDVDRLQFSLWRLRTLNAELRILVDALRSFETTNAFPERTRFRLAHEQERDVIDKLSKDGLLREEYGNDGKPRYTLTLQGFATITGEKYARLMLRLCDTLLPVLKDTYRRAPEQSIKAIDLVQAPGPHSQLAQQLADEAVAAGAQRAQSGPTTETSKALGFLRDRGIFQVWGGSPWDTQVVLSEAVLDAEPLGVTEVVSQSKSTEKIAENIKELKLSGYRLFRDFSAEFGKVTVIIGANGSGKSSLFDFLKFLRFAVSAPLPAEIDPHGGGRRLFNASGTERISFALVADLGQSKPLRYEAEIVGPKGDPYVSYERLATVGPLHADEKNPFVFLDFRDGSGVVRDQLQRAFVRPRWNLERNELALRRAVDPSLFTLARFQRFVSSWSFYSGFEMAAGSAIRRPVPTEPKPVLAEDGSNLSAVLFSLMADDREAWSELETHIRSVVPGFVSLNVVPRGEPGNVITEWIERSEKGEITKLTVSDLSDGTLRFLCWAAICLSATTAPLVCIDEPELGLHPRVLPVLAALFRLFSQRSQVLIATHSPYFLSQFPLDLIAVMRKEDGQGKFKRPSNSAALRREIKELGADALAQLYVSDELEVRS